MIYFLLARLMPTKTVDRAVGALTKFAKALEAAEAAQTKSAESMRAAARRLNLQAQVAQDEAERAARVRNNILDLTA